MTEITVRTHWAKQASDIKAIKHYRITGEKEYTVVARYGNISVPITLSAECTDHCAVVVKNNGACYVGYALQHPEDQYVRRIGYNISCGRAVKASVVEEPDFYVDSELEGKELFDEVVRNTNF